MTDENPLLLLDVDGVVNAMNRRHVKQRDQYGHLFNPECVAVLEQIVDVCQPNIVLHSAWGGSGLKVIRQMWEDRRLPGHIHSICPKGQSVRWLAEHPHLRGVQGLIIDDDECCPTDAACDFPYPVFIPNPTVGLTPEDLDQSLFGEKGIWHLLETGAEPNQAGQVYSSVHWRRLLTYDGQYDGCLSAYAEMDKRARQPGFGTDPRDWALKYTTDKTAAMLLCARQAAGPQPGGQFADCPVPLPGLLISCIDQAHYAGFQRETVRLAGLFALLFPDRTLPASAQMCVAMAKRDLAAGVAVQMSNRNMRIKPEDLPFRLPANEIGCVDDPAFLEADFG